MSFLSNLFRRKPPYVHPTFGKMCFQKVAPDRSYWEGHALFAPTKTEIEVFVDGDASGVAPGTLEFYNKVQEQYHQIVAKFQPEIVRQLRELSGKPLPVDFASTCQPSSVSVPDTRLRKEWDIGMECLFDSNLSVTIDMEDWDKGLVVIDS
jgi:hypothetical protein